MEPLTIAKSFATIVSLLGSYKAEQKSDSQDEFNDFVAWLIENDHSEIKELLSVNAKATVGIKAILSQDREALFTKLEAIDEVVSKVASSIEGFDQVASALRPDQELSDQAKSVLKQLVNSGGSKFLQLRTISTHPSLHILGGSSSEIEYNEPQFMEDDLSTLVRLGLLNIDYNDNGDELYVVTRTAAKLVSVWK